MSMRTVHTTIILAAALVLAACQKPAEKQAATPAPAAMQPAPESQPAAPTAEPATPASAPAAPAAMTAAPAPAPKPAPKPAVPAAKPAASTPMTAKPAAPAPKPAPVATTTPFSTIKCMACHAIDHDKVGPAWKTVVEKYGDEATLARDFEAGFKERRVANSIAKWKSKEGLMTPQFLHLIKGHEKEAAHALFMTVKHGKFGSY